LTNLYVCVSGPSKWLESSKSMVNLDNLDILYNYYTHWTLKTLKGPFMLFFKLVTNCVVVLISIYVLQISVVLGITSHTGFSELPPKYECVIFLYECYS
jgi:hypothetical protein